MNSQEQIAALGNAGSQALSAGNFAKAAEIFDQLVRLAPSDRRGYLGLAMAKRGQSDANGAHAALDGLLKLNIDDLPALMMKGDLFSESGNSKSAAAYYSRVIALAPDPSKLPPEAAKQISRAKEATEAYSRDAVANIQEKLKRSGYDRATAPRRFTNSIDMLAGVKKRYVEEPTSFYYAELPAIGYYDRSQFPWLKQLEASAEDIAAEFRRASEDQSLFVPYVKADESRPHRLDHPLMNNMDWSALFLVNDGELNEQAAAYFPKTLEALQQTPLNSIENCGPMVLFSRLRPGTRIAPHTGLFNYRLICHLPVIVPGDCGLRVGDEVKEWKFGEAFVFNDSIEHEAWNNSERERVILLFSIWRPELTEEEKKLLSALLTSGFAFKGEGEI